jgi:vacuolar-type H+-ATPase subunit I/STV1
MAYNLLDGLNTGNYSQLEGTPSQSNKDNISEYQKNINNNDPDKAWGVTKKNNVINLLNQIEEYTRQNRETAQKQVQQLTQSESILKKEIKDLDESNTVLKDLIKENIDQSVQNVCNTEYAEYYDKITELNYKLAIIVERKEQVKGDLIEYDNDINTIQNYIQAISS